MAGRRNTKPEPERVRCCGCRLFVRDTSGSSRNVVTGVFFMGTCPLGHGDGIAGRVMADSRRVCSDHISFEGKLT